MPRRKKKAHELTNEEALQRVFGKHGFRRLEEMVREIGSKKTHKKKKRKP
jgi:hypothetical protein